MTACGMQSGGTWAEGLRGYIITTQKAQLEKKERLAAEKRIYKKGALMYSGGLEDDGNGGEGTSALSPKLFSHPRRRADPLSRKARNAYPAWLFLGILRAAHDKLLQAGRAGAPSAFLSGSPNPPRCAALPCAAIALHWRALAWCCQLPRPLPLVTTLTASRPSPCSCARPCPSSARSGTNGAALAARQTAPEISSSVITVGQITLCGPVSSSRRISVALVPRACPSFVSRFLVELAAASRTC